MSEDLLHVHPALGIWLRLPRTDVEDVHKTNKWLSCNSRKMDVYLNPDYPLSTAKSRRIFRGMVMVHAAPKYKPYSSLMKQAMDCQLTAMQFVQQGEQLAYQKPQRQPKPAPEPSTSLTTLASVPLTLNSFKTTNSAAVRPSNSAALPQFDYAAERTGNVVRSTVGPPDFKHLGRRKQPVMRVH
jgi:hypothetical protein